MTFSSKDAAALERISWQIVAGLLMTIDDVLFSLLSGLFQCNVVSMVWAFVVNELQVFS